MIIRDNAIANQANRHPRTMGNLDRIRADAGTPSAGHG